MYKLKINDLVEKYYPKNNSEFARAIHMSRPAAANLRKETNTRIEFDTLTALCHALHCTPNDILIDDDISNNDNALNNNTDDDEDKALAAHLKALSKTIPNSIDIKSKEDARIVHLANKLILSYLQKITDSSDADGQKILESISKKSKEWEF